MSYEQAQPQKVKRIIEKEEKESLYIRVTEKINSSVVINNHIIVSNDSQLAPRYLAT